MMSDAQWASVRHFKREEWVHDPAKVEPELVFLVDELAHFIRDSYDAPCIIHVAYEGSGHAQDSQHYLGRAVDLHFVGVSLFDQYFSAERFPFNGIGVYPHWRNPGLHLDVRRIEGHLGARWWRDNKGVYRGLDRAWFAKMMVTQIA